MAIVTYVLGDCPGCGALQSFGNVDVYGTYVFRGCKRCRYKEHIELPPLRKKLLYLDQFFFSHAFRGGDERFRVAAERIERLASFQLLLAPFSSIHEDETHQWERSDDLWEFIKSTARGHEFVPSYEVEQNQIVKALKGWLENKSSEYVLEQKDALGDDIHRWDSYLRIDVGRYVGDADLIRELKRQSVEGLVDLFDGWRQLKTSFEEDLLAEHQVAAKTYIDSYVEFALRVAGGDYKAIFDAPIVSQVVQTMLYVLPDSMPPDQKLGSCAKFLASEHFKEIPYQWLNAHIFATLKHVVKHGDYKNRGRALKRLLGFFYDVRHAATYAPYVDAMVLDQSMTDLVSRPTVRLAERYGTKIFSLNNWDDLLVWLDGIEADMSAEHLQGLRVAYP